MPEGYDKMRNSHIHFVGIGGAGMSGIAEVLYNLGYEVSGTDLKQSNSTERLESLGVNISFGHHERYVNGSDIVVYSSAIPADNPELLAARHKRIPVVPRAQMLSDLMRFRPGIAVTGTHGKTTTTSLVASLLAEGGLDPTYVIGGRLNITGSHAKLGKGKYLVAEADESDASFLRLQPVYAVLTNIDADHLENCGGSYDALRNNFVDFLYRLPFDGLAVMCSDDTGVKSILAQVNKPCVTYGIDSDADYKAGSIEFAGSFTHFTIARRNRENWLRVKVNLPGRHNVLNALAAVAIATELGVSEQAIKDGLSNFQGIARRSSVLGDIQIDDKTLLLIDDYAHHPSEIAAQVNAVATGWPDRKIITVFEPHRFTRTRDLFEEFCQTLSGLDVLILMDVYPAGEQPIQGADSRALSRGLRVRGKVEPVLVRDRQDLLTVLKNVSEQDDILLLLGAGDIGTLGNQLFEAYGKKRPGGDGF